MVFSILWCSNENRRGEWDMARRKVNKSEQIRNYLAANPQAPAGEIAKALNVQPALVYNVKSTMKSAAAGRSKPVRRRAAASAEANGSADHVVQAARLIQSCGGIDGAREALNAAQKVSDALTR